MVAHLRHALDRVAPDDLAVPYFVVVVCDDTDYLAFLVFTTPIRNFKFYRVLIHSDLAGTFLPNKFPVRTRRRCGLLSKLSSEQQVAYVGPGPAANPKECDEFACWRIR